MQLSELDLNKTYSYADYYNWTFEDRVELINGKVYQMVSVPSSQHQEISTNISNLLKKFLNGKKM